MLLARATAEAARAVFPDVLAGISYTVEELQDDAPTGADQLADITLLAPPIPSKERQSPKGRHPQGRPRRRRRRPRPRSPTAPTAARRGRALRTRHTSSTKPDLSPAPPPSPSHSTTKASTNATTSSSSSPHLVGTDVGSTNDLTAKEIGRVLRVINAKTADELADIVRRFREAQ